MPENSAEVIDRTNRIEQSGQPEQSHSIAELARRIEGIRFAMLTLPDAEGQLHGRPLTTQGLDAEGSLWFLVSQSAEWTAGIVWDGTRANAAFSDSGDQRWVSISGTARLVDDPARIADMWNPMYQAWFEGPDDPDLMLLRFDTDTADYWDADANRIVRLARMVKAAVTGDSDDMGDRGTIRP